MLNSFFTIIRYEILLTLRQAYTWLTPLLFFIIVVCLFPLALGPSSALLTQCAASIIWVAALLAILLSVSNLFRADMQEGFLDLLLLSPYPLTGLVLCKIFSHWLIYCLPLIVISPVLGLLLHLDAHTNSVLTLTLLLGTPIFSLLGAIGAALVAGVRNSGLLLPVLIMPLYIPMLIFGTATVTAAGAHLPVDGYLAIMGALVLFSLAFAPLLTAVALRIGVNQ